MATIYKAHGEIIYTSPKNGKDFQLEEMQAVVNGYIEVVYLDDGLIMVVNEEGKLNGLAINWNATKLYRKSHPWSNDIIVGDVLVCDYTEIK